MSSDHMASCKIDYILFVQDLILVLLATVSGSSKSHTQLSFYVILSTITQ